MSNLLSMDRMVVRQKGKLIELTNEYAILDENGNQVGAVREEGQTKVKKLARFLTNLDQFMTHTYSVYDAGGSKVAGMVRPRKFLKSRVEVTDGLGAAAGTIVQENVVGKKRFSLQGPAGEPLGAIQAENLVSWDFRILDAQGAEVGRIHKKWSGIGRELFTTADTYMVELDAGLAGQARLLAVAAAVGIDTALKQDSG